MNKEEHDNGMTIADMSEVNGSFLSSFRKINHEHNTGGPKTSREELTSSQSIWFILGAMKAGFLIAAVYGIVYFIVLLLMTTLWK